jgi:hemerythrin
MECMAFFTWSENFSVGVREMDAQHQKLVAMVNQLHDAMAVGKGNEMIGPILTGLVDYTKSHFAAEERLMSAHGYPTLPAHKVEHENLVKQVGEIVAKFKAGKTMISVSVMNFLRDWLMGHIKGSDKGYGMYLNGKGVR